MPDRLTPKLALFFGAACVSLSPILTKLTDVPGLSSSFYRVFIALILFTPYVLLKKLHKVPLRNIYLPLLCGVFFGLDLSCWNQSLMMGGTAVPTVLGNLAPVWTGIILLLIGKQIPDRWYWVGVIIALVGLVVLIGWQDVLHLKFEKSSSLALVAGMFYACYLVITTMARSGISTLSFMFYCMIGNMVTALCIGLLLQTPFSGFSFTSWSYLFLLAIIPQLIGWISVNHSLGYLPSTIVSMVLLSQIVIATLLGVIVFKEQLMMHQILGGLIVIAGISVIYLKKKVKGTT